MYNIIALRPPYRGYARLLVHLLGGWVFAMDMFIDGVSLGRFLVISPHPDLRDDGKDAKTSKIRAHPDNIEPMPSENADF